MSLRINSLRFAAAILVCGAASAPGAETNDGSVMYRCPGNDYKNTISAKEAEKLGCRKLEGAPISVIQTTRPRSGAAVSSTAGASGARVDPIAQRARDSDARRILEGELKTEEDKLAAMQRDFNNGQPERMGDEKNYQKYIDRVAEMRAAIARKQTDIAALRREIQKLPPSVTQ
jgi:chromosome segregation ATPase